MDNTQNKVELEEGEISDLEDGEIEDDEGPEIPVKIPLISETPQVLQSTDFSRNPNSGNFRGGNLNYFNQSRSKPLWRRDGGPPIRFIEDETRFWEREGTRMRTRPSFHHDDSNIVSPRQGNVSRKKSIQRISPNLPIPLRPKPFYSQQRKLSPTPETDNGNDFDLLLERHKQIQLQLDRLEKEESAAMLNNEDYIDDSFVDIPVDPLNIEQSNSTEETYGKNDVQEINVEQNLPKSFEPFKIKPLRPPVLSLKELSNRQRLNKVNEELLDSLGSVQIDSKPTNTKVTQESKSASPKSNTVENSQGSNQPTSKKIKRRRRRKRAKDIRKTNIVNKGNNNINNSNKDIVMDVPKTAEQNTLDSRLLLLASSSVATNTVDGDLESKRGTSAEQQKKRRERLKQWQQSRKQDTKSEARTGKGRGGYAEKYTSPGGKPIIDSKDFEQDDYLEAPMDVESDTPDGPVLPLIEEAEDDAPPPPPPLPSRDQELMALIQEQQMAYNNYSIPNMMKPIHMSPNIHGFYPPGQFIYGDWSNSYSSSSVNRDGISKDVPNSSGDHSLSSEEHRKEGRTTPSIAETEDDDDEATLLREILLKSVAKKRAAKSSDLKDVKSQSAPASPRQNMSKSPKLTPSDQRTSSLNQTTQKPSQQSNTIRKIPIQPPKHDPVVIRLGQDSDSSDEEEQESAQGQRGFVGSIDMMLKQARNSVENSKPKQEYRNEDKEIMTVPKTPDALTHLSEERRAEYRRLKEQLAQHEGKKRQPLSDISQDKETKSENETGEINMDSSEESRELLELKEKVKTNEEKLSKHRKSLSQDQEVLVKMTSLLSEKTLLLEVQETRVSKLKKQLEMAQKAMLNNRLVIKKLHEKAIKVKDKVSSKMTVTSNIEEELLRLKSMVSAVRKDPSFNTGSDSNENKETVHTAFKPPKRTGPSRVEGSLKRSLDDSIVANIKKAKTDTAHSQSAKSSPRKSLTAERIAQEKARLKRLEQDLAERLSHFTKSSSKSSPNKSGQQAESTIKQSESEKTDKLTNSMEGTMEKRPQKSISEPVQYSESLMVVTETEEKELEIAKTFAIVDKQLDYIKKLQAEKEKKGPSFPESTLEIPQPLHKRTAMCIWLESNKPALPTLDINTTNFDWLTSTSKPMDNEEQEELEEPETNRSLSIGSYQSILLYFRSYRLSPYFRTKEGLSLNSLTFTHKLNPFKSFCDYELKGVCNDGECKHQHKYDYTPTDTETMQDLAAYQIKVPTGKISKRDVQKKINLIVEKFLNQYKGKISMDQLFVLLVNSVQKGQKSMPYNICGSIRPALICQNQQPTDPEDSKSGDRGRGVQFSSEEDRERKTISKESGMECQEVRYFSEDYNSIKTLSDAVEESPSDIALWIKLSRLQLHQTEDNAVSYNEEQNMALMQCLNTLSRGLEANPNSEELWLEYLKLFRSQGHSDEHKELCEQAIGFTPTYNIWWHYLDSLNTYHERRTVCLRLINQLAKKDQDEIDELHSHRILESLLYLVQLELCTGRQKLALLAFQSALKKRRSISKEDTSIPRLTTKISAQDLCLAWLAYIHVLEFHRLPAKWFDPKNDHPGRIVSKDKVVFPWQPGGGTVAPSERILGMFHEALRSCTLHNKASSNKILVCLPLYQNLLALERAHGRLDSAKGICRRLLQGNPGQVELWQCLAALEETTGKPKQALVVLNEGLKQCGYDWQLVYTIARLYLEQGEPAKAIETLVGSIKSRYMDPDSPQESPKCLSSTETNTLDPVLLYRKLLSQPIPYDSKPPVLMSGMGNNCTGRGELYLWLAYCLLLELSPSISPLCLQYNLSAESAYETAVHTILNRNNVQAIWLEYLFYKISRVLPSDLSSTSDSLKPLHDLVNRCLMSVSASRTLPYSISESWLDYSFYNKVINLYLGCLPQSLWSAVFTKYLKMYPGNLQLTLRACEHEVSLGCSDQAIKMLSAFLAENPLSITMWKILISLNLRRNHTKEAHKLYQQSTDVLPFAATLWKDFIMFDMVWSEDKSSVREIIQQCGSRGIEIKDYLNTLLGKL